MHLRVMQMHKRDSLFKTEFSLVCIYCNTIKKPVSIHFEKNFMHFVCNLKKFKSNHLKSLIFFKSSCITLNI